MIVFTCIFVVDTINAEKSIFEYDFISKKNMVILRCDNNNSDTLHINSFRNDSVGKNIQIDSENNTVITLELKSDAIDSFSSLFFLIRKWEVKDNKFIVTSATKVRIIGCHFDKLTLSLTNEGVQCCYKKSLFSKKEELIKYEKLIERDSYELALCI